MFQLKWANKDLWSSDGISAIEPSKIDKRNITRVLKMDWEEHCVECAIPECYHNCPLYEQRKDGACARFVYGIIPNPKFSGHYNFGADVTFRRWGKIEASLQDAYPVRTISLFNTMINYSLPKKIRKWLGKKEKAVHTDATGLFDEFVIECYSVNEEPYKLICEYFTENNRVRNTKYRNVLNIQKGFNHFNIPFHLLNVAAMEGYIYLYPENSDIEKRLIFTWLDLVKYKRQPVPVKEPASKANTTKVKCVAWDLDNTFWNGTFIEQETVAVKEEAVNLVKKLDERGIIQTIISKNDFDPCWEKLKTLEMDKYFLVPAINWDQKSKNLSKIVEKLNIGLDTIAVIDDSPFERSEIVNALPQVRVYSEKEIDNILSYEEFNVLISEESKDRRNKYQREAQRIETQEKFAGSYEDFLISCNMVVEAFVPGTDQEIERCFELIQRSNQLNLSTIRYSRPEFSSLLADKQVLPIGIRCEDKFGDYGLIGFSSINVSNNIPVMENLVLSCRIAQKRVEHTYMKSITALLRNNGYKELCVKLTLTAKNGPLCKVFSELPFTVKEEGQDNKLLSIQTDALMNTHNIMKFTLKDSVHNFKFR